MQADIDPGNMQNIAAFVYVFSEKRIEVQKRL